MLNAFVYFDFWTGDETTSTIKDKGKNVSSFATHIQDLITEHRFLTDDDDDRAIVNSIKEDVLSSSNQIAIVIDENNLQAEEEQGKKIEKCSLIVSL